MNLSEIDKLRKEIKRKELKYEASQREMQNLRSSANSHQRELRLLNGVNDKLLREKEELINKCKNLKETIRDLTEKLEKNKGNPKLIEAIEEQSEEIENLEKNSSILQGEILLRDETIRDLEYKLDVLQRSIQIQNKYEGGVNETYGPTKEKLRSLYFELGKKNADLHALSISIAELTMLNSNLDDEKNKLLVENLQLKSDLNNINLKYKQLSEANQKSQHECQSLKFDLDKESEQVKKLNIHIEDLVARIAELRVSNEALIAEKDYEIDNVKKSLDLSNNEKDSLKDSFQTLSLELERFKREKEKDSEMHFREKDILIEEVQRLANLSKEKEVLYDELLKTHRKLDQEYHDLKNTFNELKLKSEKYESDWCENHAEIKYLKEQLRDQSSLLTLCQQKTNDLKNSEKQILAERDELAEALKKSMTITRQYVQSVKEESSQRYELEKQLEICKNIKDSISNALLEVLHNERLKRADNIGLYNSIKKITEQYNIGNSQTNISKNEDMSIESHNNTNHSLISSIQKASEGDYDWLFPQSNQNLPLTSPINSDSPKSSPNSLILSFKDIIEGELDNLSSETDKFTEFLHPNDDLIVSDSSDKLPKDLESIEN